jgi:TM2 domain-containing membrane protein YozV
MKKTLFFMLMSFVTLSLLNTSCSIEKRHYMAGYNVDWKSNKNLTANHEGKTEQHATASNVKQLKTEPQNQSVEPVFHQATAEKSAKQETPTFAYAVNVKKAETENSQKILSVISKTQLISTVNAAKKAMALMAAQGQRRRGGSGIQIIALILCFFVGLLGIHSFYIGNRRKGTIQLILFLASMILIWLGIGLYLLFALGVWVIIDFIRLLIGDLGPGW